MGRREQAEARQQSDTLYNLGVANARSTGDVASAGAKRLSESTGYSPEYKARLAEATASKGYSPGEESAISQETEGAASSAYDQARDAANLRLARTRNSAGFGAMNAELAREKAKDISSITNRNMLAFADERRKRSIENLGLTRQAEDEQQRRQEEGLGLSASLYGTSLGGAEGGLGYKTNLANQKGFGSKLQDAALAAIFG